MQHSISRGFTAIILGCFIGIHYHSIGQDISKLGMPLAPNAASLAKYGETPVDLSSGMVNVSIPIYQVSTKNVSLPISLTHHNNGLKVEEMPSWVGYGWDLNAGGMITRQVNGRVDEGDFGIYRYMDEYKTYLDEPTNTAESKAYQALVVRGERDTQFDVYSFNFLGRSGSFIIDEYDEVHLIPKSELKFIFDDPLPGQLSNNFRIIDENGITYIFNRQLVTQTEYDRDTQWPQELFTNDIGTTTWYLTKIIDTNNEAIDFNYSLVPQTFQYTHKVYGTSITQKENQNPLVITDGSCEFGVLKETIMTHNVSEIYLEKITFPLGEIVFNASSGRLDIPAFKLLDNILVKTQGQQILEIDLVHDNNANRLQLKEVNFRNNGSIYGYDLEYYSGLVPVDYNNQNFSKDHWGYYNGVPNTKLIPSGRFNYTSGPADCLDLEYKGADRRSNADMALGGMLKRLTYPTGGYTVYEYEGNTYSQTGDLNNTPLVEKAHLEQQFLDPVFHKVLESGIAREETYIIAEHSDWKITWSVSVDGGPSNNRPERADISIRRVSNCETFIEGSCSLISKDTKDGSSSDTMTFRVKKGEEYQIVMGTGIDDPGNDFNAKAELTIEGIRNELSMVDEQGEPIAGINIEVGGLRVKKVTNYDYTGSVVGVKKYSYNDEETGLSFGLLNGSLTYHTDSRTFTAGQIISSFNLSSSFLDPVDGSHIFYKKVKVIHGENGENGSEVFEYEGPIMHSTPSFSSKPFALENSYLWRRNLKNHFIYNSKGSLIRKTINNYSYGDDPLHPPAYERLSTKIAYFEENDDLSYASTFIPRTTRIRSEFMHPVNTIVTDYYGSETIERTTTYKYDKPVHMQLTNQIETSSDGGFSETEYKYSPDNWSTDGLPQSELDAINEMENRHIIGIPLEVTTYKDGMEKLLSTHSAYAYNSVLDMVLLAEQQKSVGEASFETEITFTKYDTRGNTLEFLTRDGISNVLIWGYNKQYVVARVQNAAYAQVEALLGSPIVLNGTAGDFLSDTQIDTLRSQLPNSLVTTYKHRPLIGLVEQTDPNGQKTTYEYDDFGRLYWVKDNDESLVKKYEYKIGGN